LPGEGHSTGHDLVVIGASAGGVEAVRTVVANLPPDLPAAIVVVLHLAAGGTSVLPSILDRAGPLPAQPASNGEELRPGTIYVAVPDCHVEIDDGHLRVEGGPRENGHRPAIDPLFRSAARARRERTIGVILSGALDDGTRGLRAIKAHGGVTLVQDPRTALHPSMPTSAIRVVAPERVLSPEQIAAAIAEFVARGGFRRQNGRGTGDVSDREDVREQTGDPLGNETGPTCPECGGAIYEQDDDVVSFRCRVGHRFTADAFVVEQATTVESSLWAALRLLEERAVLMRTLAERHDRQQGTTERFGSKAEELERHAEQLTELLREFTSSTEPVPAVSAE
jgi:two-component system chemotaxis response regulator CheB